MNILNNLGTQVKNHVSTHKGLVRVTDTETNILNNSSEPVGALAYATDTQELFIYIGSSTWLKIQTTTVT